MHFAPLMLERFNRRKRAVTPKWHVDETYVRVSGRWMYLYRAIDSMGDTVEFFFSENRDLPAAKRFISKGLNRHGRPERIVIDGSQTNREAIIACDGESRLRNRSRGSLKPIRIRQAAVEDADFRPFEELLEFIVKPFDEQPERVAGSRLLDTLEQRHGPLPAIGADADDRA